MSFPKKGKFFPDGTRRPGDRLSSDQYSSEIAAALQDWARTRGLGAKVVASWTGANEKTVKNWFAGRYGPSGEHLVVLVRQSDEMLKAFLKLADREDLMLSARLAEAEVVIQELLESIREVSRRALK